MNCAGKLLDLSTPVVMGILNISPDSFYDGGKYKSVSQISKRAKMMIRDGATIIDIGANSSRPGSKPRSEKDEWKLLEPALKQLLKVYPYHFYSIDTFYSGIADRATDLGVHIVNDISAGSFDKNMFKTVVNKKAPYILMHMKGKPATMQNNTRYKNVTVEVIDFLRKKVDKLRSMGALDIVVDPGFGFGKDVKQNYTLLKELNSLKMLDCPVLAGLSRKSFICKVLDVKPDKALHGTIALNMLALTNGASILRVHDVREAMDTIKLFNAYTAS